MSTLQVNEAAKLIIFSDFDGTITLQDTGIILIDEYLTTSVRKELDDKIFTKTMAQR
jgi:2-hydroxy-3-keto-5-methylthiopentenyl-1-phosphate phosphatase